MSSTGPGAWHSNGPDAIAPVPWYDGPTRANMRAPMLPSPLFELLESTLHFEFVDAGASGLTGRVIAERTWPCLLIAQHHGCLSTLFVGGEKVGEAKSGEAFLAPPEIPHRLVMEARPGARLRTRWMHVNYLVLESVNLFSVARLPPIVPRGLGEALGAVAEALAATRSAPATLGLIARRQELGARLFSILISKAAFSAGAISRIHAQARFVPVLRYIRAHLTEPISVPLLAELAGLSPSRFSDAFKGTLGLTPADYVRQQKLRQARMLLLSGHPVHETARLTGWGTPFSFSRAFKSAIGMSPDAFRREP